jgi:TolB-like protein/DNA-binding winged helix-turn-helix (wHTH) protein/Tfp pilus assembly protein PilF
MAQHGPKDSEAHSILPLDELDFRLRLLARGIRLVRFLFDNHVLDVERRELSCAGAAVALEPQVFDLLLYLIENRDRVISKDELFDKVWNGRIVSESTLTSRINSVRNAVKDTGRDQRLLRTFARKGFRFIGDVHADQPAASLAQSSYLMGYDKGPGRLTLPALDRTAIAVLPFINLSDEVEQEYFSDGISEDIITALSKLRWFYVIARNSSFVYKGKSVHLKQIGDELGVAYVVEGSVRKDGERVRITAQLNNVATGSHIWAERYDRDLADVFAVQDEITQAIVAAIEPQLYAAESFRAQRKAPDSMDAWDLVMRALSHYWRVTRQDNTVAQALLEKAIAIDPQYGQALGVLAASHSFGAHMGWEDTAKAVPVAERAALAAIHADSEDAWAHYALASVYLFTRRFDDCLAEFELTLRLNPSFSPARGYYGVALAYCGRWEEGDQAARHALRLSPRDPFAAIYYGVASYSQFVGGKYEEAIDLARQGLRLRPDFVGAHRVLTAAAAMTDQREMATKALQELRRVQPNLSLSWLACEMPFKGDAERDRYLEAFRRAGLR